MRVSSARVEGFRLLAEAEVSFENTTTIIVGRNNSGKTSFVEAFYKFLGSEQSRFSIDDFSLSQLEDMGKAGALWERSSQERSNGNTEQAEQLEREALAKLPSISLEIEFAYDESESLAPISKLILDLDPDRHDATLLCRFELTRPSEFLKGFVEAQTDDIIEYTRKRMAHFSRSFLAIDKEDRENVRLLETSDVRDALATNFIYAQNLFDDTSSDTGHGLSKGFESYYRAVADTDGTVESLETALVQAAGSIDSEYSALFSPVFDDLKQFGADTMPQLQELRVVSRFDAANLLRGSTTVKYEHASGQHLPEAHNGLGYSKLIFIVLQFVAFFEAHKNRKPRSGVELLFVEEPEAHLHPQMQSVFVRNINDYLRSKTDWNVQLVVTTHSSHIVAESGFAALRYFDTHSEQLQVKDLNVFRSELEADDADSLRFLEQYMELRRCDMFFADKVILVEGTVERLLLPKMIQKHASTLKYSYISVVEVGGAYAVKFRSLLDFLGVQTLIITDIDSVQPDGHHKKTKTSTPNAITSNVTLKNWLPGEPSIAELNAKTDNDKIDKNVRIAYQIAESDGKPVGRSFEEAFILANLSELANVAQALTSKRAFLDDSDEVKSAEQIEGDAYDIAGAIESKSDFAFDILMLSDWNTPKYVEEGLEWLALQNK